MLRTESLASIHNSLVADKILAATASFVVASFTMASSTIASSTEAFFATAGHTEAVVKSHSILESSFDF